MRKSPQDLWNYDYCIEEGQSMQCPFCGESENVNYTDSRDCRIKYFECSKCGAVEED